MLFDIIPSSEEGDRALQEYLCMCTKVDRERAVTAERSKQVADQLRASDPSVKTQLLMQPSTSKQNVEPHKTNEHSNNEDQTRPEKSKHQFNNTGLPWYGKPDPILNLKIRKTLERKRYYLTDPKQVKLTVHLSQIVYGLTSSLENILSLTKSAQDNSCRSPTPMLFNQLGTLTSLSMATAAWEDPPSKSRLSLTRPSHFTLQKQPSSSFMRSMPKNLTFMKNLSWVNSPQQKSLSTAVLLNSTKLSGNRQPVSITAPIPLS
ncbi:hypothetical protein M422DRAFT_245662 [Sphaerobolus stellatus SS14]|nr:hypothetical protein M422DRAFT_245662 [Sphaerobolus stellatus SS14]